MNLNLDDNNVSRIKKLFLVIQPDLTISINIAVAKAIEVNFESKVKPTMKQTISDRIKVHLAQMNSQLKKHDELIASLQSTIEKLKKQIEQLSNSTLYIVHHSLQILMNLSQWLLN